MENLLQLDEQLFYLINNGWQNPFLDAIMPIWREKSTWIPLYVLLAGFIFYRFRIKGLFLVMALGLLVGISDNVSSQLIKKNVRRIRPCNDGTVENVHLIISCGSGYSFPSTHAVNHFVVATFLSVTLGQFYKKIRLPLLLWAASIALGQVYVGVHYPLDILCGALLGIVLGYIGAKLYLQWDKISIGKPVPQA
ncbi:MAG: phosphatase PAP2 family protein [Saprospiraceae bacterium]